MHFFLLEKTHTLTLAILVDAALNPTSDCIALFARFGALALNLESIL